MARTKSRDATPIIQRYVFSNLKVAKMALVEAEDNENVSTKHRGHERLRQIKEHDIEVTGQNHPTCRCNIWPGMTVDQLLRMTTCMENRGPNIGGWVCPRTDRLRRMYGH